MKPPPPDEFTVRAYALDLAIKLISAIGMNDDEGLTAEAVSTLTLDVARPFEGYLAGRAADQAQHADAVADVAKLIT